MISSVTEASVAEASATKATSVTEATPVAELSASKSTAAELANGDGGGDEQAKDKEVQL